MITERPYTPSVLPLVEFWPWLESRCWISLIHNDELYYMEWDLHLQKPISFIMSTPEEVVSWCISHYGPMGADAAKVFVRDCVEKGFSNAVGFRSHREIIADNKCGFNGESLTEAELVEMFKPRPEGTPLN